MIDICYSGGSKGADELFGLEAEKVGHKVRHFSFWNHHSPCKNTFSLNMLQLQEGEEKAREVNKLLQRKYPTRMEYVNNLIRRNWYQVKESNRIYAVSFLEKNGFVGGGTGWTVTMGIQNGIREVYVFNYETGNWLRYVPDTLPYEWEGVEKPSMPYGRYTGIGSHDLPENGERAIRSLYLLKSQTISPKL